MNTEQALLLIDISKTLSFNKTAERLFIAQQSVSYKVKQLERELNTEIFVRSKNGVAFTSDGQDVLQCAQDMMNSYEGLTEKLKTSKQITQKKEQVVLYVSSVLVSSRMTNIIRAFNELCPNVRLVLKEGVDKEQIIQDLLEYKCDLAFWSVNRGLFEKYRAVCVDKDIQIRVLLEDSAVAVVSSDSELAKSEILTRESMSKAPKSTFGVYPVDYFGKNIDAIVLYENNNIDVHRQLVLEEHAICYTTNIIADRVFNNPKMVKKSFDYPTLPIQHMLLKKSSSESGVVDILEKIIAKNII